MVKQPKSGITSPRPSGYWGQNTGTGHYGCRRNCDVGNINGCSPNRTDFLYRGPAVRCYSHPIMKLGRPLYPMYWVPR